MNASRRVFLRAAGALGAGGFGPGLAALAALASQRSHAAADDGYRALVCLFLNGGNDSHNWVVPIDAAGYAQYAAVRRDLAWPAADLRPIAAPRQAAGREFGMPVELEPLHRWYGAGRAAFVANVGPLTRPLTRADYLAGIGVPAKLFSHNDQQSTWMSLYPEGAGTGWGGRIGDVLMAANPYPVFTAMSASGNAVFLAGQRVVHYHVGSGGPVFVRSLANGATFGSPHLKTVLARSLVRSASGHPYEAEYATVMARSLDTSAALGGALAGVSLPALPTAGVALGRSANVVLANDPLARQLQIVAKCLTAAQRLGMRRQVYMVSLGGFDSHASQMRDQPTLMARVALAVDWFLQAVQSQGLLDNVLLFSASDFGRTLTSNGDGCDHGWGSHHFVAGGAVKGGDIHGRFPAVALGTAEDVGSGRLLPSTSVTEFAATCARWMGVADADLGYVLPNYGHFGRGPAFV